VITEAKYEKIDGKETLKEEEKKEIIFGEVLKI